jgi:integral membrane protein
MAWRLLKFLGVALFAGGVVGSVLARDQRDRLTASHYFAVGGFLATWVAGYELMKLTGRTLEPWILAGMAASVLALLGSLLYAHKERPRWAIAAIALGGLMASVVSMVLRAPSWTSALAVVLVTAVLGSAAGAVVPPPVGAGDAGKAAVRSWLHVVALVEGASLILLTLVSMPLKYGFGSVIDGGGGRLGWIHGVIVLVFVPALVSGGRALGWSWATIGLGFVASMLPFGSFWFMARRRRGEA